MITPRISRRRFMAAAGMAVAGPTILPASVFGAGERPAPSNRINLGVVGWGWQGGSDAGNLMKEADLQIVAISDLDKNHLAEGVATVNKKYAGNVCKTFHDYRELIAQPDIDAILVAVPDHWHALVATEAARHKKDIYGEKPLARTIAEQQAIVKAVHQNNCIWQTGSWQRSEANFHYACEIVRNGMIGKVTRVEVGLPSGHNDFAKTGDKKSITAPPPELDYETWIGPSRMEPYIEARSHKNWRWNYNTGGGQLLDWIGHHCDIAHWGMGYDNLGPYSVEGHGEFPPPDAVWNTATKYRVTANYPGDITMIIAGGYSDIKSGTKWIGTDGWVWVDRNNAFAASNAEWENARTIPADQRKVELPRTKGGNPHYRNFLDSVKSRKPTVAPSEVAHHSAIPGHLGLIAMLTGRKVVWDIEHERILEDAAASQYLTRMYRKPWKLA